MPNRRGRDPSPRRYPRSARVNEVLRQVIAEELERLADVDPRLALVTVTTVTATTDLRQAVVLVGSLPDDVREALGEHRVRLQAAVARQVRLKRTPQLAFEADPAIAHGQLIEDILRGLDEQ